MAIKTKNKSKFNKDTSTYKKVASAALDAVKNEIDKYDVPDEAKDILKNAQDESYDKLIKKINTGEFKTAKDEVVKSVDLAKALEEFKTKNMDKYLELEKDVAKVVIKALRLAEGKGKKGREDAQKLFDENMINVLQSYGFIYKNMPYDDNIFITKEESESLLADLEKAKEKKKKEMAEKEKQEKLKREENEKLKEKNKEEEVKMAKDKTTELDVEVPDVDLDLDEKELKELEEINKDAKSGSEKVRDLNVDGNNEGEDKPKRVTADREYVNEVVDHYKTKLSEMSSKDGGKNLSKLMELNSKHCEFTGFLCNNEEKVIPKVKKTKKSGSDTVKESETYALSFYQQKPSKPKFAIVTGPKAVLEASVVTQQRLNTLGKVGIEGDLIRLSDEDIKNKVSKLLTFDQFSNYLIGYTDLRLGIRENEKILDEVYAGKDAVGTMPKEGRIVASIETYAKKKQDLLSLQKEYDAAKRGVKLEGGKTELALQEKIATLEEQIAKMEKDKKVAVVVSSVRGKSKLLTRKNFIPLKKYITRNPFTEAIDQMGPDDKKYFDIMKQAYNKKEVAVLENEAVCSDQNNYKFFESNEKVSIDEKKKLLAGHVAVRNHWYTGALLSAEDINVPVKLPSGEKQTFKFLTVALGQETEFGKYDISSIENKEIIELVGGGEEFRRILDEASLIKSKEGRRKGRSKVAYELQESLRLEFLQNMNL